MQNIPITKETTLEEVFEAVKAQLHTDNARFILNIEGETRKGFILTNFKLGYSVEETELLAVSAELSSEDQTPTSAFGLFPDHISAPEPKKDKIDLALLKNLTERLTYSGLIKQALHSEDHEALFVGDSDEPLANLLEDSIDRKLVTVRFWISEEPKEKERLIEDLILNISGSLDATYQDAYSDYTGYLWTDEEIKVGNHDLLKDLSAHVGKYVYLEIDVHN